MLVLIAYSLAEYMYLFSSFFTIIYFLIEINLKDHGCSVLFFLLACSETAVFVHMSSCKFK